MNYRRDQNFAAADATERPSRLARRRRWVWRFAGCLLTALGSADLPSWAGEQTITGSQENQSSEQDRSTDKPIFQELMPNVTPEMWQALADLDAWPPAERVVMRILDRLSVLSKASWQRLPQVARSAENSERWPNTAPSPGTALVLRGKALGGQSIRLTPDMAEAFQRPSYYLVKVEVPTPLPVDSGERSDSLVVGVLVPRLPRHWQVGAPMQEPVVLQGLVLSYLSPSSFSQSNLAALFSTAATAEPPEVWPLLAASRVRWYPSQANGALKVSESHVCLSQCGFDLGLFEQVQLNSEQSFLPEEQELFTEFFRAVKRLQDTDQAIPVAAAWDVVDVVRRPQDYLGQCVPLTGTVRRVTPVLVESADVAERLGSERYYQLDLFLKLGNRQLNFLVPKGKQTGTESEKKMTIRGEFGVTVLLDHLPEALADYEPGESLHADVELPGFFLKQWRHTTLASQAVSDHVRKPNPIFVGLADRLEVRRMSPLVAVDYGAVLFFAGLVGLTAVLLITNRVLAHRPSHLKSRDEARGARGVEPDVIDWTRLAEQEREEPTESSPESNDIGPFPDSPP